MKTSKLTINEQMAAMVEALRLVKGSGSDAVLLGTRAIQHSALAKTSAYFDVPHVAKHLRWPPSIGNPAPAHDPAVRGRFVQGSYANAHGARDYRLYIPSRSQGQELPLVVMLHGCTQSPEDFALGTRMNEIAEERQSFVLYPGQNASANSSKCWNWFNKRDQQRDQGEPSIIAGMIHKTVEAYHIDKRKIFVAGMSSGGAMAIILATTYPELFAATGIHSGLPYGSAHDLPSALAAMRAGTKPSAARKSSLPVIVFHGDQDKTVHPRNGHFIIEQSLTNSDSIIEERSETTGILSREYSRTIYRNTCERTVAEHWVIHGAAHAWSGGSERGSHTDPKGPDASREMMRFFVKVSS